MGNTVHHTFRTQLLAATAAATVVIAAIGTGFLASTTAPERFKCGHTVDSISHPYSDSVLNNLGTHGSNLAPLGCH